MASVAANGSAAFEGIPPDATGWVAYFIAHPSVAVTLGLVLATIATRLISTANSDSQTLSQDGGVKTVPAVPYWLPILGHIPNMAIDADGFVKGLRTIFPGGIFALNFGGHRHNIISTPGLTTALLNQPHANAESEEVAKRMMKLVFGFPAQEIAKYDAAYKELFACYKEIQNESGLGAMVSRTTQKLCENINNLVTGLDSYVDQMPWERVAKIDFPEPTKTAGTTSKQEEIVVEASLLPLIRDFCAWTANPSVMGSDFLANFPDFFANIWTLDAGFILLATGLPRWFPIPALTRAHIAKKNNLDCLIRFEKVLQDHYTHGKDSGPEWTGLDDVGDLIKARMKVYEKYNWSLRMRASIEHALMWAANANSNTLVFWLINRVYSDRVLLALLREEIAPYIDITLDENEDNLPISSPPRISHIDIEALCTKCPLLKSTYVESLRLDAASWSLKVVRQDFVLRSRDEKEGWALKKGDYAHAAHDLHNTDPRYFEDPLTFKADRHIKDGNVVDLGSIRPYGGGASMCKGRQFALKEVLLFTATIVSMWEIEPKGGGKWKMPKHKKATGTYTTNEETRVWVKRRKFPA